MVKNAAFLLIHANALLADFVLRLSSISLNLISLRIRYDASSNQATGHGIV
jgi:hypothetical protein